jgi:hypothetical protein
MSVAASFLAIGIATHVLHSNAIVRPDPVFGDAMRPMGALKLERVRDDAAAQWLIENRAPGAKGLLSDWNGVAGHLGTHHFAYPTAPPDRRFSYVPVPRPGWENVFGQLQHTGLSGINLYELHPPASWTPRFLDALKYKWAVGCGVKSEWIEQWSSFRSPDSAFLQKIWSQLPDPLGGPATRLRDECRPGGTCFIVSNGCSATALEDFQAIPGRE